MRELYIIPDKKNIEASLELAREYDCCFEYNDFYLPDILENRDRQQEMINFYRGYRKSFEKDTLHGAFFDVTLHSNDPLIQEVSMRRVRQTMQIAREMNVRAVIFHTGRIYGFREEHYIKNWMQVNEEFFRAILKEYPNQQIYMENMFDEAPDILAELAYRMRDEKRFGICLDYAHAMVYDPDSIQWIRQLEPYIRHIHINDNDLQEDLHLGLGKGRIDWELFNRQLLQCQADASVLIEVSSIKIQQESLEYLMEHHIYPR